MPRWRLGRRATTSPEQRPSGRCRPASATGAREPPGGSSGGSCPLDGPWARTRGRRRRSCRSPCRRRHARTGPRSFVGRTSLRDLSRRSKPSTAGHPDVEQDDIRPLPQHEIDRRFGVVGGPDEPKRGIGPHERPEHVDDGRLVVGDEHPDRGPIPSPVRWCPRWPPPARCPPLPRRVRLRFSNIGRRAARVDGPRDPTHRDICPGIDVRASAPALLEAARRTARPRCDGGNRACAGSRTRGCERSSRR